MVMEMCPPKGRGGGLGGVEAARGGAPAAAQAPPGGGRPKGAVASWPFFFLGLGAGVEGLLPLLGVCQGG
jgi:hypothetical protein